MNLNLPIVSLWSIPSIQDAISSILPAIAAPTRAFPTTNKAIISPSWTRKGGSRSVQLFKPLAVLPRKRCAYQTNDFHFLYPNSLILPSVSTTHYHILHTHVNFCEIWNLHRETVPSSTLFSYHWTNLNSSSVFVSYSWNSKVYHAPLEHCKSISPLTFAFFSHTP